MQEHKLLQAIARVNRVYDDKDFGYIIDYYGVIRNLDSALTMYFTFQDFDADDLEGTLTNISEEIKKMPQKHSALWDIPADQGLYSKIYTECQCLGYLESPVFS